MPANLENGLLGRHCKYLMGKPKEKPLTANKLVTMPRLVIFCLLVLVLIMGAWVYLRNGVVNSLIISTANLESQNYQIGHDGLSISGFPFSVNAALGGASLRAPISATPDPTKNWSIKTDSLRLQSATLTPLSWNIEHRGQMRIDMRGRAGERYTFDITPATVDGRVVYSMTGVLKAAQIDIDHAQLDSLVGTPPIISQFDQFAADIKVMDNSGRVTLSGTDVRLSPRIPSPLDKIAGRKLALIELNANIENWALLETQGAAQWMTAKSRVNSEHWAVQWGLVDMIGDFDITFNNGLPEGVIQIRIKNPNLLLDKLIDNKLIPEQYAGTVRTLVALQKPQADGRKPVEITIKDGVVKTGFIPIYKF